jgi:glycosyltransferase involved in cell wall biosynthesis
MIPDRRYVIITPARNEGQYLENTIRSVVAQTVKPRKWIIVNDGSTDNTAALIDAAGKEHSWIQPLHRRDRGFRNAGGGVIEAFYDAYRLVRDEPWDFLVKLDGDLSFEPSYFAATFDHFDRDSRLGVGGGTVCSTVDGNLIEESKGDPAFHVRGATKIYRRPCWEAIGGLIQSPGWDTLDEVKANMLGWRTYSFPNLKLIHHRYSGDADGAWKNWVKNGRANYITGYHPVFMLLKCAKRLFEKPVGVAAFGLLSGFVGGYLQRVPRVKDRALIAYLRRQQINRLLLQDSLWDSRTYRTQYSLAHRVA